MTDKGNIVAELYQDTPESAEQLRHPGAQRFLRWPDLPPGGAAASSSRAAIRPGDGSGGPGYTIPAEIKHIHPRGALAWARTGDEVNPERRSSGSQFYITLDETPFLDGGYTVFGYVIEGMDVADKIAAGDKIQRIDISKATASQMPTPAPSATPAPTATPTTTPTPFAPTARRAARWPRWRLQTARRTTTLRRR